MNISRENAWLWFCSIPNLNWQQRTALIQYFGSPQNVFSAEEKDFSLWEKMGIRWIRKVREAAGESSFDQALSRIEKQNVRFISCEHPDFPEKLHQIADSPHGLFFKGSLPDPHRPAVAVVGSRICSNYGKVIAADLAGHLAAEGIPVISGMAVGIDGIAQRSALENGCESYGILGCGADICYPKQNFDLYWNLCTCGHGGILSEYACGTDPYRTNFPWRNRIISALSDAVVVIEARKGSGSLITADYALDQGKEVYAVPGRCSDERSAGGNLLIRQGAAIYISAEDFIEQMKQLWSTMSSYRVSAVKKKQESHEPQEKTGGTGISGSSFSDSTLSDSALSDSALCILDAMDLEPADINTLSERTGRSAKEVASVLTQLQLCGRITEISRNYYAKNHI